MIAITGTGLITPLGADVNQTWQALLAGEFIHDHARVDPGNNKLPQVSKALSPTLSQSTGRGSGAPARVTRLACHAAREAWTDAQWDRHSEPFALIVGTSKGPVEDWIAPPALSDAGDLCDFSWGLARCATELNHLLPRPAMLMHTLSAACASGLHALIHAAMLLQGGGVRRALVVGAEASVHPLFISSFKRLGVLPKAQIGCRPFDELRDGFLMSDAAAAVCLQRIDDPDKIRARPVVLIDQFALAGDAAHLTSADTRGAALKKVLRQTIDGRRVDLVHAHGTGTPTNDPIELAAIESELAQHDLPWLYSHKGALGHSLGAAGLVATVLSARMHTQGMIPPNIRTTQPIAHQRVRISQEPQQVQIARSIAIAAGFGGALAGVSLVSA